MTTTMRESREREKYRKIKSIFGEGKQEGRTSNLKPCMGIFMIHPLSLSDAPGKGRGLNSNTEMDMAPNRGEDFVS